MIVYRAWDRDEKLGPPPWKPDDSKVVAWEAAHGHDVRLKCYPEFGCYLAIQALEKAARELLVLCDQEGFGSVRPDFTARLEAIRIALEAL